MKLLPLFALLLAGCVTDPRVNPARMDSAIERGIADGKIRRGFADQIKAGKVALGMNMVEVILAWGQPHDANSRVSRLGRSEQWVYRRGRFDAQYVYFENGVVTSISSS